MIVFTLCGDFLNLILDKSSKLNLLLLLKDSYNNNCDFNRHCVSVACKKDSCFSYHESKYIRYYYIALHYIFLNNSYFIHNCSICVKNVQSTSTMEHVTV